MAKRNSAFRIAIGGLTVGVVLCLVAAISLWKVPASNLTAENVTADAPQNAVSETPIQLAHEGEVDGLLSDTPQRPVPDPQEPAPQESTESATQYASAAENVPAGGINPDEPMESAPRIEAVPPTIASSPADTEPTADYVTREPVTQTTEVSHRSHATTRVSGTSAVQRQSGTDEAARQMETEIAALKGQINDLARTQLENQLAEIRHAEQLLTTHQSTRMIEALQREVEQLKADRLADTQSTAESLETDAPAADPGSPASSDPSVTNLEPDVELGQAQDLSAALTSTTDSRVRYSESTESPGRFDVEADDATLQEFVAKLGPVAGWNLVSGPELTGNVTLRWSRVDLRQALTHQLKVRGWQIREDGDFAIIEAISTTTTHPVRLESPIEDETDAVMRAPITLKLAPGAIEGSTYDQSTGIRIQPGTSSRSLPVSRTRMFSPTTTHPAAVSPTPRLTPLPASATHEPQNTPAPLLMQKAPAPVVVPAASQVETSETLAPPQDSIPVHAVTTVQPQVPPVRVASPDVSAAPVTDAAPSIVTGHTETTSSATQIDIVATIIETLSPERRVQGILPQSIAVSDRGPCPTCGQKHAANDVPFGHALDGWFEMNDGIRCGVCAMSPELIIARLQQTSNATITSNPRARVLSRQVAEIGLTEKQGFRRIKMQPNGGNDTYAILQGGVDLALRPTLGEDGNIRLDLQPMTTVENDSSNANPATTHSSTSLTIPPGSCAVIGGLYFGVEQPAELTGRIGSMLTGKFTDREIREVVVVIELRPVTSIEPSASPASLSVESDLSESESLAPAPLLIPASASPILERSE